MSSIVAFAESGFEPIPGYVLREKLGSGGFGEVWLADAPGGLKKALKLVFGSIDDDRAAGELRSLQRIRQVNHPFVLSLERIEVVNGQLIVVTELADGSLLDRFNEMQRRGLIGIPRDRLLKYLGDAADALDFICQEHDLQHLDVKPANLLLIADRIKLADFGLIKDVQRTNHSLMGGLTPTYAAPEMFDGRPGRASDQYALAIVYQEMLSGQFPFQGRTTAQLANEHLHKAPNLESLPINDRPIIAKALSKKPLQRFSSCRKMIDALLEANNVAPVEVEAPTQKDRIAPRPLRPKAPLVGPVRPRSTEPFSKAAAASDSARTRFATEQISPSATPVNIDRLTPLDVKESKTSNANTFFIGLGRTGIESLVAARHQLQTNDIPSESLTKSSWIAIDSSGDTLQQAMQSDRLAIESPLETIHLQLKDPLYYKERPKDYFSPISRRWMYNVPRSKTTEGVRALGMLAFLDNSLHCYETLYRRIGAQIINTRLDDGVLDPVFYLVASSHGGTGGAIVSELAFLIRRIVEEIREELNVEFKETITMILTAADREDFASLELPAASGLTCLSEIKHHVATSGLHPGIPSLPFRPLSIPPLDDLYVIHGGRLGRSSDWRDAVQQAADFLCDQTFTPLGAAMALVREQFRKSQDHDAQSCNVWLRTCITTDIKLTSEVKRGQLSKQWALETAQRWISSLDISRNSNTEQGKLQTNPAVGNTPIRIRKPSQAIDSFSDDLFRDAGWNAQAWVRSCFAKLLPATDNISPSDPVAVSSNQDDTESDFNFPEIGDEVSFLASLLPISERSVHESTRDMIDKSMQLLLERIRKQWTSRYQHWAFVKDLLKHCAEKLERQSESLKIVGGRFAERLKATEDLLAERSDFSVDDLNKFRSEKLTLTVQRTVHFLAAKLQLKLRELVLQSASLWEVEVAALRKTLSEASTELAAELGYDIDQVGRIRNYYLPLPSNWSAISNKVQMRLDKSLADDASNRLSFVWSSLADALLIHATKSVAQHATSENSTIENQSSTVVRSVGNDASTTNLLPVQVSETNEVLSDQPKELSSALYSAFTTNMIAQAEQTIDSAMSKLGADSVNQEQASYARLSLQTLAETIRDTSPPLMAAGGAMRVVLLIPSEYHLDEHDELWRTQLASFVTIIRTDFVKHPKLVIDGERLILEDLFEIMWPASADRYELANRLFSRTDIDWPSI